jgi:hypothetical protein
MFEDVGVSDVFRKMGRDSAVQDSEGSWFHYWGARIAKSLDWAGGAKRPEVAEQSARVVGFEQSLKVGRVSSSCSM